MDAVDVLDPCFVLGKIADVATQGSCFSAVTGGRKRRDHWFRNRGHVF
jgi:hypothetical protein